MPTDHYAEFREEATRLRQLTPEDRRAFIAMLRRDGANTEVPREDRHLALTRANALERLLGRPASKPKYGSTRLQIFRLLDLSDDPMTPRDIRVKLGILKPSGNIYDIIREEVRKGRIRKLEMEGMICYVLSSTGLKALRNGEIDKKDDRPKQ